MAFKYCTHRAGIFLTPLRHLVYADFSCARADCSISNRSALHVHRDYEEGSYHVQFLAYIPVLPLGHGQMNNLTAIFASANWLRNRGHEGNQSWNEQGQRRKSLDATYIRNRMSWSPVKREDKDALVLEGHV